MTRIALALFAACAVLAGCSSGDSRTADLKFVGKPGDSYKRTITMNSSFDSPAAEGPGRTQEELKVRAVNEIKCIGVEGDVMNWEIKTLEIEATGTGEMAMQAHGMMQSQSGRVEKFKRDSRNKPLGEGASSLFDPIYPNQPVRVGDEWRSEAVIQSTKMLLRYAVVGFEKVGDKDTIVLTASSESPNVTFKKPLRLHVDTATGWPLKGDAEVSIVPQRGFRIDIVMGIEPT